MSSLLNRNRSPRLIARVSIMPGKSPKTVRRDSNHDKRYLRLRVHALSHQGGNYRLSVAKYFKKQKQICRHRMGNVSYQGRWQPDQPGRWAKNLHGIAQSFLTDGLRCNL